MHCFPWSTMSIHFFDADARLQKGALKFDLHCIAMQMMTMVFQPGLCWGAFYSSKIGIRKVNLISFLKMSPFLSSENRFCPIKKRPCLGLKCYRLPWFWVGHLSNFTYFHSTSGFSLSSRGRKIIASRQPIAPHVCDLSCNVHSIGIQYSQLKTRVCHSAMDSVMCCIFQRHTTQWKIHASTNKKNSRIFLSS